MNKSTKFDPKTRLIEFIQVFQQKYPNINYDFSKAVYVNSKTKLKVICSLHGEFWMRPNDLLNGIKCPKCSKPSKKYTLQEFIEKANNVHDNKYDYSKVKYIDSKTPVCIICPVHGEFWQVPREHLRGCGCKRCSKNWKLEIKTEKFLLKNNIIFKREYSFEWLKSKYGKQSVDFYLPEYNSVIECQGLQHFVAKNWNKDKNKQLEEFNNIQERDQRKLKLCNQNNINIYYFSNLHINYPYKVYEDLDQLLIDIKNNK